MREKAIYFILFFLGYIWFSSLQTSDIHPGSSALATLILNTSGILNSPGYPLFGLASGLLSWVPFESFLARANFLAAFCGAISGLLVFLLVRVWVDRETGEEGFIPAILAWSIFLITPLSIAQHAQIEKYSVSFVFLLLFAIYFLKLVHTSSLTKKGYFILGVLVSLTVLGHYSYLAVLGACGLIFLFRFWRHLQFQNLFAFAIGGLLGMAPLLYFPLRAAQKPLFNWWNPDGLEPFLQLISRRQYFVGGAPLTWDYAVRQITFQYELLLQQWSLILLLIVVSLLVVGALKQPSSFLPKILLLPFLGLSMSLFVRATSFIGIADGSIVAMDRYMWPFYLPWITFLIVLSCTQIATLERKPRFVVSTVIAILVLLGAHSRQLVGPHPPVIREWIDNWKAQSDPDSIFLTAHDAIYTSLVIDQLEGRISKDTVILHQSLLPLEWYQQTLQQMYPEWYRDNEKVFSSVGDLMERYYREKNFELGGEIGRYIKKLVGELRGTKKNLDYIDDPNVASLLRGLFDSRRSHFLISNNRLLSEEGIVPPVNWSELSIKHSVTCDWKEFPHCYPFYRLYRQQLEQRQGIERALFPLNQENMDQFFLWLGRAPGEPSIRRLKR